MKAYKGFDKGLTCRGYKFKADEINITEEANCVKNGFHCAENPLDCLTYYPNMKSSEYWIVDAGGDLHEDGSDSKISCTELSLVKKLSLNQFLLESMIYIYEHPYRECGRYVEKDTGSALKDGFVLVRGKYPVAKGVKGSKIGLIREKVYNQEICEIGLFTIDGKVYKENTYYDASGHEVKDGVVK